MGGARPLAPKAKGADSNDEYEPTGNFQPAPAEYVTLATSAMEYEAAAPITPTLAYAEGAVDYEGVAPINPTPAYGAGSGAANDAPSGNAIRRGARKGSTYSGFEGADNAEA